METNDHVGICFSGGGIRSGSFSVGVLEQIIDKGLLEKTKEISSVSGGGFATGSLYSMLWSRLTPKTAIENMVDRFQKNTSYLYRTHLDGVSHLLLGAFSVFVSFLLFPSLGVQFADFLWSDVSFDFVDMNGVIQDTFTNSTYAVVSNSTSTLKKLILEKLLISSVLKDISVGEYNSSIIVVPVIILVVIIVLSIFVLFFYYLLDKCYIGCSECVVNGLKMVIQLTFFIPVLAFLFLILIDIYKLAMYYYAIYLINYSNGPTNTLFVLASFFVPFIGFVSFVISFGKKLPSSWHRTAVFVSVTCGLTFLVFAIFIFITVHCSLWILYKSIHPIQVDMFWDQSFLKALIFITSSIVFVLLLTSSVFSGIIHWIYANSLKTAFLETDFNFGEPIENIEKDKENPKQNITFTFNACVNNLNRENFLPYYFSASVFVQEQDKSCYINKPSFKNNIIRRIKRLFGGNGEMGNTDIDISKSCLPNCKLPKVASSTLNIKLSEVVAVSAAAVLLQMGKSSQGIISPLITFVLFIFNFNLGTWITLRNHQGCINLVRVVFVIIASLFIGVCLILDTFFNHSLLFLLRFLILCVLVFVFVMGKLGSLLEEKEITNPKLSFLFELFTNLHIPLLKVINLLLLTKQHSSYSDQFFITDGGHFDNLGLYTLLSRRKYKTILCFDAGEDVKVTLGCLNFCLQKAKKDELILSYQIEGNIEDIIPKTITFTESVGNLQKSYESINKVAKTNHLKINIEYSDKKKGVIWYGKSVLCGDESNDLLLAVRDDDEFPNHPTYNQHFSGTLFSHYYKLGKHVADSVIKNLDGARDQ